MKYWLMLTIWIGIYLLSMKYFKYVDYRYFVVQSFWSLSAILIILPFERSYLTLIAASLELSLILINYVVCYEYMFKNYTQSYMYHNYEVIMISINAVIFALLLYGGFRGGGILKRIPRLFASHSNSYSTNYWLMAVNKALVFFREKREKRCNM